MWQKIQPIRLTILGDFWDSQIYKGRLYLWDMNNTIRVYNWESFIESLALNSLRLPFTCAFSRGDLLYQPSEISQIVFDDPDVRQLLYEKFNKISESDLAFSLKSLDKHLMSIQDSPFGSLPDDSALYKDTIYALTDSGLYAAKAHKASKFKNKVDRTSEKLWDGTGTSIQVGNSALAISAADEGLFEYNLRFENEPYLISNRHTLFANWAFASIYGSSDVEPGYLAAFRWQKHEILNELTETNEQVFVREFNEIVSESSIFKNGIHHGATTLSWGNQEKLYRVFPDKLDIVRFTQSNVGSLEENRQPFAMIDSFKLANGDNANNEVISAGTSYFGVVLEYDQALAVIESTGDIHSIPGSITRWRVFPRSLRYENHLHVIFDDRISIFSFNNDYFVNQRAKSIGIEYRLKHKLTPNNTPSLRSYQSNTPVIPF